MLSSEVRLRARLGGQLAACRRMLLDLRYAGSMPARDRQNAYSPVKTLGTILAEVSTLDYKFALMRSIPERGRGVIARYRDFLPVNDETPIVSLGEGDTPLIYSPRLSERIGRGCDVFVKNEGVNPTGSFKDRGMTVAVSKAIERGARTLICASTGNTSASAAAYAARAGISCVVILPGGKIATGKLLQAFAYGAKIVAIDGNFDDALRIVRELGERGDFAIVNSINPDRIAGQKTAAFEIRIGNPASWKQTRAAIAESHGAIDIVSDEEILAAQKWLARHEGILAEPASAAAIAGLFKCRNSNEAAYSFQKIPDGSGIVCTITGHGLKDPDIISQRMKELEPVAATVTD